MDNRNSKKRKRQKIGNDKEVEVKGDCTMIEERNEDLEVSENTKKLKIKKKLKKREQKENNKINEDKKHNIAHNDSKVKNATNDLNDSLVTNHQQLKGNESLTAFQLAERKKRMIFVGNIPLSFRPKQLWKIFKSWGIIEKIWFRSIAPKSFITDRANIVKGKMFGEQKNNKNAYILFQNEECIPKALEFNNYTIQDGIEEDQKYTLRVDSEVNKENDFKTTIFVGNLPFVTNEEELRSHFETIGKIINVRIVRDSATLINKGIAFIQFETKEQALKAVKFGIKSYKIKHFKGRQLRIKKAVSVERRERKKERLHERFINPKEKDETKDEADDVDISKLVKQDKPNEIEFHNDIKLKKHRK